PRDRAHTRPCPGSRRPWRGSRRRSPRAAWRCRRAGRPCAMRLSASPSTALVYLLEQQEQHDPAEQAAHDARDPAGARAECDDVERREDDADDDAVADAEQIVAAAARPLRRRVSFYSHSIVPGGLLVMSST